MVERMPVKGKKNAAQSNGIIVAGRKSSSYGSLIFPSLLFPCWRRQQQDDVPILQQSYLGPKNISCFYLRDFVAIVPKPGFSPRLTLAVCQLNPIQRFFCIKK